MAHNYDHAEHDEASSSKKVTVVGGTINAAGQATITPLQAWPDPKTYIGLVTITGSLSAAAGNITLDPGSQTQIKGNLTLSDSKGFIGLTTTTVGAPLPAGANYIGLVTISGSLSAAAGNITLDPGSKTQIVGNVTLSDSKTFIGLTTSTIGAPLPAGANYIGLVTIVGSLAAAAGNITLDAGSRTGIIGNVTIQDGGGSLTVDGSVGVLGNVTLSDSKGFIGLVTVVQGSTARSITGNITLSDSKTFIGLVTAVPAYGSNSTVYTGVISATGNTTVLVAPASNRFFLKNLHISSLGRSEVEVRSGATTLIPFTSLSTTAGYFEHYGEQGLPARAQTDALVINLNGGATISYMANVRFEP